MRICYLADAPYIHSRRWVEHFSRLGWETHVISFRPAEITGSHVHYVGGWERLGKLRYLIHARRVRRLIRELAPDLVHALHLTSYGFLAALADVHPCVVSVWGTDILQAPRLTPFHWAITRYALSRADRVTATGMRLAEATMRYVPAGKEVAVIPYGVDLEQFRPEGRSHREELVVGSVGRLSPEKGLKYLMQAMAEVVRREPRARLLLAGDGPERGRLRRLAVKLGLQERTDFLGEIAHEQVPATLARVDVFAMPSTYEGFGVAALEAEAMEVPVVASAIYGIPDVVEDGVSGLLVPPKDVAALSRAILRLLADEEVRRRMGVAARAFVAERYSWQENARQMEALYQELLEHAEKP
ncbi:MAG: glycosyltransferase [Dehalococcoidia bacterium]|jgi:glycosyltransferase involved in cell wall biosynthesis